MAVTIHIIEDLIYHGKNSGNRYFHHMGAYLVLEAFS